MNFLCELTIVIPRLPCLFSMAITGSLTIELGNVVTANCVDLFNVAMCALASKCVPIELVVCYDGWCRI